MFRQNSFSTNKLTSDNKRGQSFYGDETSTSHSLNGAKSNSFTQSFTSKSRSFYNEKDVANSINSDLRTSIDEDENSSNVFLKSSGKFINKHASNEGGLITTFWNYPIRNTQWPIIYACFNTKTGNFAIADERGQVYRMSIMNNIYQSVRLASTPVSCMTFLYAQKNLLAIAYENGVIVIINSDTKDIVGNIQVKNKATARIIACHPTLARIVIATDDRVVSMWDFGACTCLQSLECEEAVVDVRYELNGDVVAITLEQTGAYLYGTESCQLLVHLTLPESERRPVWTAYCSCLVNSSPSDTLPINNKKNKSATTKLLNVMLTADNSMVYSWCVDVNESVNNNSNVAVNLSTSMSIPRLNRTPTKAHLVGIVELPIKMRMIVSMVSLGDAQYPPRVALLSADGSVLLVDIDGFRERSVGYWTVVSDLPSQMLQGAAPGVVNISASAVGKHYRAGQAPAQQVVSGTRGVAYGKLDVANDYLVVVGQDGGARLVDTQLAVKYGELCGSLLRSRAPFVSVAAANAASRTSAQSAQSHSQTNLQCKSHVLHQHNADPFAAFDAQRGRESRYTVNDDFYLQDSSVSDAGDVETKVEDNRHASTMKTATRQQTAKTAATSSAAEKKKVMNAEDSSSRLSPTGNTLPRSAKVRAAETKRLKTHTKTQSFVAQSKHTAALKGLATHDTLHTPLFELATLTPKEKQVNLQKLKTFLSVNGEYPSRYRPLIWRFLLRLPENTTAYSDLVQRGVHPAYDSLFNKYPIENKKTFTRLQNLCSQMTHWAPILAEASYLPSLVFPFVLLYGSDELAALETSMTVMMWWGFSWHATHPNPPLHLIDSLDNLLKFHDAKLYFHLTRQDVAPGVLCWTMLSSLFSELLSRNNWCKLMDFLFTYIDNIAYILLVPVVIMRELKVSLLGADTAAQINAYCRTQQGLDMDKVVNQLQYLMSTTPPKHLTGIAAKHIDRTRFLQGTSKHVVETGELDEVEQARENMALTAGSPIFPLPAARYPAYDGFPSHVVDLQIKERNRVLALGLEVSRKEGVLNQLQRKLDEIESDHAAWMNRHLSAGETELQQQKEAMEREKTHLRELHRIEEDISMQRIKALQTLENAAKEEMALMDRAAEDSKRLLIEGETHMREKMQITLSLQKHRELAEQAEIATQEKIRTLRMRRAREDWVKGMSGTLKMKEEELAARDAIVNERWKKQDDEVRLQRELRVSQAKAFEDSDAMSRMQEELSARMQRLQMDREAKIIEIERARAIRLAKEQAEEAIEAQERAALILRKQEVMTSTEQSSILSMLSAQQAEQKMMETVSLIREESSKLIDAERVHALRSSKARQDARQAQLRKEWAEKSAQQLQAVLATEGELQEHMLRLQRAAVRSEADAAYASTLFMDEIAGNSSIGSSADFENVKRDIETMGEQVLSQQRERFREMKQYIQNEQQQQQQVQLQLRQEQQAAKFRPPPPPPMQKSQQQTEEAESRYERRSGGTQRSTSASRQRDETSEFRRLEEAYYIDAGPGLRVAQRKGDRMWIGHHDDDEEDDTPSWMRSQSDIPAPSYGAGIGYGVQPPHPPSYPNPLAADNALSAASIAAEARGAMSRSSDVVSRKSTSSKSPKVQSQQVTVEDVDDNGSSLSPSSSKDSQSGGSNSSSTVDNQLQPHRGSHQHRSRDDKKRHSNKQKYKEMQQSTAVNNMQSSSRAEKSTSHTNYQTGSSTITANEDSIARRATQKAMHEKNTFASDSELSTDNQQFGTQLSTADAMKIASQRLLDQNDHVDIDDDPTHWDSVAMSYDQTTAAPLSATAKHSSSQGQFTSSTSDSLLPPSLSLPVTLSAARGGARYGKSGGASNTAAHSSSNATQTLGNSSATLRTSSSSLRSSGELKRLSEETLRNLQETRALNRSEVDEETQHEALQRGAKAAASARSGRGSSISPKPTKQLTPRELYLQRQRELQQQQQQQSTRPASAARRSKRSPTPQSADLDVTVDSDSALWAFEASGEF